MKNFLSKINFVEFSAKFFAHFPRDIFENWDSDVSKFAEFDYATDSFSY